MVLRSVQKSTQKCISLVKAHHHAIFFALQYLII
jgi:hypothetical protein